MSLNNLNAILCFVLAVVSFGYVSAQWCTDSQESLFFKPNSTYDTNRRLVLSTLASDVSSNDGFYNVTVGEGPERIYAIGMCIPGSEPHLCSSCIKGASDWKLTYCPNQTDSFDWSPHETQCYIRYSNSSFYNKIDLEPRRAEYFSGDIPGNVTEFNRIWEDVMKRMIVVASSSTHGLPARMHYAASITPLPGFSFLNLYALMHCIPGISSGDCEKCLLENVRTQQQCCSEYQGGSVRRPVCYSRSDTSPFYGAFDKITVSPPPQSPQTMPPLGDLPNSTKKGGKNFPIVGIVVPAIILLLLILGFFVYCTKMMKKKRKSYKPMKLETNDDIPSSHPLQYCLKTIEAATDNFSYKLGEGGFGVVYKGTFPNGTEAAVKRLSTTSRQGLQEFKNEVIVVGKLQHNNLVKLLGYCMEGEEKILVYEFLSNKSLDLFLFDTINQPPLDWTTRYNIIEGIARGIQYLHQDSRLRVIHRDLKASNILLDAAMKPKIADFGLAKIFAMSQTRAETSKIAGTFGYMPPEYMNHGQFSMESDVYGFGVLVLEIISGNTCSRFYRMDDIDCNLGTYAWKLWSKGSALTFVDPSLGENYQLEQVTRCIHIALLCVQVDPSKRPKLSEIITMLTTIKISESVPSEPGFFAHSRS